MEWGAGFRGVLNVASIERGHKSIFQSRRLRIMKGRSYSLFPRPAAQPHSDNVCFQTTAGNPFA